MAARNCSQWVGPARSHEPRASHRNIVAALTAKNPKFSATFTCNNHTHYKLRRDAVHIKATAGGDTYRTDTCKLKEGESQVLPFTLNELFGWLMRSASGPR